MIFCAVRFWVIIDVLESVADEETKEKEDETEDKVEETKPEAEPDPEPEPKIEEGMLLLFPMRCWKFHNNCYICQKHYYSWT